MIGLIVEGLDEKSEFTPLIYHRFGDETVVEMTTRNCLNSASIHKVIVAMPSSQRRKCQELNLRRGRSGSSGVFHFEPEGASLDMIYEAASEHALDHIVRVRANSPLLPSWLVSKAVKFYFQQGGRDYCRTHHSPGFDVDVFPYWMLADAWTYSEEREDFTNNDPWGKPLNVTSGEQSWINNHGLDLTFNNIDNLERWDYLVQGVNKGHDIEDLIEEAANGNQGGDKEQPSVVE